MTNVYDYINETGVIMPDTSQITADVTAEYLAAFGNDLNPSLNTPQGVLMATEIAARVAVTNNNADLANQINPNLAGGVFLDALLALLGSFRIQATPSRVLCTLTGVAGTSIPAGAQISDSSGNLYEVVTTTVIPLGGTISGVLFESVLTGAIPGAAGTLTVIVSNILGWETVTNPAAATLGIATQTDVQARVYRLNTLALQATGLAEAIISALTATAGVTSLSFQENATSSPATINDIPMVANSIYLCIAGTASLQAIGLSLTNTKSGGCAYNNGLGIPQTVNITNPYSGQVIPVLFDLPSTVLIAMKITIHVFGNSSNVVQSIQDAIVTYAKGGIAGEPGFVVGGNVSPFQIAGAINILVPGVFVQKVEVGVFSFTQQGTVTMTSMNVTGLTYNSAISTGMGISDGGINIPALTTVSSLTGTTGLVMSANATGGATEILTFTPASVTYQTTEIPIGVFQQAIANASLITVIQV